MDVGKDRFVTVFCLLRSHLLSYSADGGLFSLLWHFSHLDCFVQTLFIVHDGSLGPLVLEVNIRVVVYFFVDPANTNLFTNQPFDLSRSLLKVT